MNLGIEEHLKHKIIPFWKNLMDKAYGGFYGHVNYDLSINYESSKSVISTARHLYTFSSWYRYFKDESLFDYAHHAYMFLMKYKDDINQGYVWMLDHKGNLIDSTKHLYAQSFVIYGLSEYYLATKDQKALDEALDLYHLMEKHGWMKPFFYHEAFDKAWHKIPNDLLAAHGPHFMYTTNTLLHMLEAYTNLYKASKAVYVKDKINELLNGFIEELYDEEEGLIYMYLDEERKGCHLGQSYGHDIESSWLIDLALKETGIVHDGIEKMTKRISEKVLERAMTEHGLISERLNGHVSKDRIWWVQAEAMVGFFNHYQKTGIEKYKEAVSKIYDFTMHHLVDQRPNAEWLWGVDEHMKPITYRGFAEHWKANYHNGRAFIELLKRGLT